jgi:hypothetical protein
VRAQEISRQARATTAGELEVGATAVWEGGGVMGPGSRGRGARQRMCGPTRARTELLL